MKFQANSYISIERIWIHNNRRSFCDSFLCQHISQDTIVCEIPAARLTIKRIDKYDCTPHVYFSPKYH